LDIESNSLDVFGGILLLLQINTGDDTIVIDCTKEDIRPIIEQIINENVLVVGHNLKFDLKFIKRATGLLITNVYDTMIAESLIYKGLGKKFSSLESLVEKYTGNFLDKSVVNRFIEVKSKEEFKPDAQMLEYAAKDVKYLLEIREKQIEAIEYINQTKILDLEQALVPVVADMEYNGIYFDSAYFETVKKDIVDNLIKRKEELLNLIISEIKLNYKQESIEEMFEKLKIKSKVLVRPEPGSDEFFEYVLNSLNINSPAQIKSLLNHVGIRVDSTDKRVLRKIDDNPLVMALLGYREYAELVASFTDTLTDKINPVTGRIHGEFNQLGTNSGRFSASKPNLQQIVSDEYFRKSFKSIPGWKFICADFSQQELRLLGNITGEEKLINAFKNNIDVHTLTASLVYNKELGQVTPDERRKAKSLNFASVYGSTHFGISFNFNIPKQEAKRLLDNFWEGYPTVTAFMRRAHELIVKKGYSITPFGRKRFFDIPKVYADEFAYLRVIGNVKRAGFNHVIQGCGADINKLSLLDIFYNQPFGDNLKIILTVHDEIVCMVKEEISLQALEFVVKCMQRQEQVFLGDIPAAVTAKISDYWEH